MVGFHTVANGGIGTTENIKRKGKKRSKQKYLFCRLVLVFTVALPVFIRLNQNWLTHKNVRSFTKEEKKHKQKKIATTEKQYSAPIYVIWLLIKALLFDTLLN